MRIVAEWYEPGPGMSTCMFHRCEAFEGETVEEVNAAIRARAGAAETIIVGCRNTLADFAAYETLIPGAEAVTASQLAREYPRGFADSAPPPAPPAPKSALRRWFEAVDSWLCRVVEH